MSGRIAALEAQCVLATGSGAAASSASSCVSSAASPPSASSSASSDPSPSSAPPSSGLAATSLPGAVSTFATTRLTSGRAPSATTGRVQRTSADFERLESCAWNSLYSSLASVGDVNSADECCDACVQNSLCNAWAFETDMDFHFTSCDLFVVDMDTEPECDQSRVGLVAGRLSFEPIVYCQLWPDLCETQQDCGSLGSPGQGLANLALVANLSAAPPSSWSPTFSSLLDGHLRTGWQTSQAAYPWLQLDLNGPHWVGEIVTYGLGNGLDWLIHYCVMLHDSPLAPPPGTYPSPQSIMAGRNPVFSQCFDNVHIRRSQPLLIRPNAFGRYVYLQMALQPGGATNPFLIVDDLQVHGCHADDAGCRSVAMDLLAAESCSAYCRTNGFCGMP